MKDEVPPNSGLIPLRRGKTTIKLVRTCGSLHTQQSSGGHTSLSVPGVQGARCNPSGQGLGPTRYASHTLSWKTKDGGLGGFLETAQLTERKTSHQQVRGVLFTWLPPCW